MALLQSMEDKTFAANVKALTHGVAELNANIQKQNKLLEKLTELLTNKVN